MQRKPFSEVSVNERIRFDNGYHMTGHITKSLGTHNGKRMVQFFDEELHRERIISYAAHRSVIALITVSYGELCACCDFGDHIMACTCDGIGCCHPENH